MEAYWDMCSSVADYYLGLREQEELRSCARLTASWRLAAGPSEMSMRDRHVAAGGPARRSAIGEFDGPRQR